MRQNLKRGRGGMEVAGGGGAPACGRGGGVLDRSQARAKAGAAALPCSVSRGTPIARARGSGGVYTGLCRAKIGGATEPCHVSGDGRRHVTRLPRRHTWRGTGIWPR